MKRTLLAGLMVLTLSTFGLAAGMELSGAGATFPEPLYAAMFAEYNAKTGVKVNYQGIGSGGGIKQLTSKTVDFGGSDAPMTDQELKDAKAEVLHFPTCLGAVVLTYNIPGVTATLKFTPDVIADIYLGKIDKWNDPRIASINTGVALPDMSIIVVRRSDGSGTTFVFTDYLSSVSPEWKSKYGANKVVNWPVGVGGKGNPGVAQYVKQVPGAIGYVEVAYAKQNKMPYALVQNKSGNFIEPDLKSISIAADVAIPADTKVSLVNTDAKEGYPICSFTWIIIYKDQGYGGRDSKRVKALVDAMWWMIHDGQKINESKDYGELPQGVVKLAEDILNSVVYNGKSVRK